MYLSPLLLVQVALVLSTASAAVTTSTRVEEANQAGRFLSASNLINEEKRYLQGKSQKTCDPKKQPFRLYRLGSPGNSFEICQRGCPDWLGEETVVDGSTPSKSAEECCEKYPDTSPDGYCFRSDQVCNRDERPFHHWASTPSIPFPHCLRGCEADIEYWYYTEAILPTTPKGYATGEECCKENGCEFDDYGNEAIFDYLCNPTDFRLYSGDFFYYEDPLYSGPDEYEFCGRLCPWEIFSRASVVQGSKASKSAKECCAKHPDSVPDQPDGFCYNVDALCICEKERFYHYDTVRPNGIPALGCVRGCANKELAFFEQGIVPSSPTSYATLEECCSENVCDGLALDFCGTSAQSADADTELWGNPSVSTAGVHGILSVSFKDVEIEGMSFTLPQTLEELSLSY